MKIYRRYSAFKKRLPIKQVGTYWDENTKQFERLYELDPVSEIWQKYPYLRGLKFPEASIRNAFYYHRQFS